MYDEGIDRFLAGTFAGDYQQKLLAEFDRYLPEHPPWKVEMNCSPSSSDARIHELSTLNPDPDRANIHD